MAENNPAKDGIWTDTPQASMTEFDTVRFDEIEDGDLFWLEQTRHDSNHAHRKVNDQEGQDLRTREYHKFGYRQTVYQKT